MKAKRLVASIDILASVMYGVSYLMSRRAAWSSERSMVVVDYAWITTSNGVAETLFVIHRPLIAIDKALSGQRHFMLLEFGMPPAKPTLVAPANEVRPAS